MSPTIQAPVRFSLLLVPALMLWAALGELILEALLTGAYSLGTLTGLYVWAGDDSKVEAIIVIFAKLLTYGALFFFARWWFRETWRSPGRAGFSPVVLPVGFVPVVAGLTIFLSEFDNLLRAFKSEEEMAEWYGSSALDRLLDGSWPGLVLAVVIAPLTEEFLFRGVILRGLLGRWKPWLAIVVSAGLFAAMHLSRAQTPVALATGLLLGWVYFRTRSLGLCMIGHAINNAWSFLPLDWLGEIRGFNFSPDDATGAVFHPWWFDLAGTVLIAGGVFLLHRLAPAAQPWLLPPPAEPPPLAPPVLAPPVLTGDCAPLGHCQPYPAAKTAPSMSAEIAQLVTSLAQRARAASLVLATAPRAKKDVALTALADLIDASHAVLLDANAQDLASPEAAALTPASRDRLTLNEKRLRHLAESVREVVALPDPVGTLLEQTTRPNGLRIRKVRVPIGVIGIIYESRPNVTVDCAILCLKSGNASILRGGKECFHTNTALAALIQRALQAAGLPADAVQLVPTTDRAALTALLKLDTLIHCIIPRGGEALIRHVAENSTIPVIKHFKGVCFVYVDVAADLAMAEAITVNAKVARPSACNAAEQLLVHRAVAERFLPTIARALAANGVELRCDAASAEILARDSVATTPATPADYTSEFLEKIIAIRVVDSLDAAIATINRDSSSHSEAIVTADESAARRFLAEVDSATVFWNASTRFNDGFEFGFGAEIGISTDRLHARGPMGLPELCTYKYLIEGAGQVRN